MDDIARTLDYVPLHDPMPIPAPAKKSIPQVQTHADGAPEIPAYLQDTYYWCYISPRNVKLLDREIVVRTILWQQHRKLQRLAFAETACKTRKIKMNRERNTMIPPCDWKP